MPDYPGVDPDGLSPGGLQVAGRVNAKELAVAGALVTPSLVSIGAWNCNTGLSMADSTNAFLPLDTEAVASPDVTYTATSPILVIKNTGKYLVFVDAYSNVGWSAGALKVQPSATSTGNILQIGGALGHEGSDLAGPLGIGLYQFTANDSVQIGVRNATGVTDTIFGDIAICRLA